MDKNKILKNIIICKNNCWNWNLSCTSAGYGNTNHEGEYWTSHRYSYECFVGEIPDKLIVRHKCHNKKCCNPDHLELGTQKDNYADSKLKHDDSQKKRRKIWIVDGIQYKTCREAVQKTGISMNSIIKYTQEGVFNRNEYVTACGVARVVPK